MRYGILVQNSKGIRVKAEDSDKRPFWHRDFIVFNSLCVGWIIGYVMLFYALVIL